MDKNQKDMKRRVGKPNLFLIGAMKCGTSSLHEIMNCSPEIFMSTPKEPCFFSQSGKLSSFESYLALFEEAGSVKYVGESSTQYAKYPFIPDVARRLYEFNPNAKLIYVVRDPLRRCISHYLFNVRIHNENRSFFEAMSRDSSLLAYSDYALQLSQYLKYFSKESILVLQYENLFTDPWSEISRLENFLDIPKINRLQISTIRENVTPNKKLAPRKSQSFLFSKALAPMRKVAKSTIGNAAMRDLRDKFFMQSTELSLSKEDVSAVKETYNEKFSEIRRDLEALLTHPISNWSC